MNLDPEGKLRLRGSVSKQLAVRRFVALGSSSGRIIVGPLLNPEILNIHFRLIVRFKQALRTGAQSVFIMGVILRFHNEDWLLSPSWRPEKVRSTKARATAASTPKYLPTGRCY